MKKRWIFAITFLVTVIVFYGLCLWSIKYTFPLPGHTPASPEREQYHDLAVKVERFVLLPAELVGFRYMSPLALAIWGTLTGGLAVLVKKSTEHKVTP